MKTYEIYETGFVVAALKGLSYAAPAIFIADTVNRSLPEGGFKVEGACITKISVDRVRNYLKILEKMQIAESSKGSKMIFYTLHHDFKRLRP